MNRDKMLDELKFSKGHTWDILVIGGGASGLGVAFDAALRGYKTLLLEQSDFAKGTSSRSTKLVHGGVRYLAQGNLGLVNEALHERGLMRENAPHLVSNQPFLIPTYDWWESPFYTAGLKMYDMMAGKMGLNPSEKISREETLDSIPNISSEGLNGGILYYDGQFDDSRLAISLAQSAIDYEATLLNYIKVTGVIKDRRGKVIGVTAVDQESGEKYEIKSKVIINATGVFVDDILKMDNPERKKSIRPSQGIHLVLEKEFLQGNTAIMIPRTDDGRVLFAVPWYHKVVLGTTDTPLEHYSLEPKALEEEIEFILTTAGKYLVKSPTRKDVLSVFAGLRPLAAGENHRKDTKGISRGHKLSVSDSGIISILGGKWTTFRKIGEDTVDRAIRLAKLPHYESLSKDALIHGYTKRFDKADPLYVYGNDKKRLKKKIEQDSNMAERFHPAFPYLNVQIYWAVRHEMARTVEDVLARRTRAILLDARASVEAAPAVARIMARLMDKDDEWVKEQVVSFTKLAENYIIE